MRTKQWIATGACAPCPYQEYCHEPRRRVEDARGVGRHTSCAYYRAFDRQLLPALPVRPLDRAPLWTRIRDAFRGRDSGTAG